MGRIKDFIAKWQTIERPEWKREKIEQDKKLKYKKDVSQSEKESIIKAEKVEKEDAGQKLSIVYHEENANSFVVYAIFEDSQTQNKVHLERFDHRKEAKDRLEGLLDEYTEINVKH
jgi:hypothetical protein